MKQPTRKSPQSPQWVVITVTNSLPEAHIMAGRLQSNDIPAMVHQEAGANALGITIGGLGEIKVLISPADYERAAALLSADAGPQVEASHDRFQVLWRDDGDGAAYYIEDDEDE